MSSSSSSKSSFKKRKAAAATRGGGGTASKKRAKRAAATKHSATASASVQRRKRPANIDLNCCRLPQAAAIGWAPTATFSDVPRVSIYFESLAARLCAAIDSAEQVVGCAAWMTNDSVLASLRRKSAVSIVVQNDDMGYRAGGKGNGRFRTTQQCKAWSESLRERYSALGGCFLEQTADDSCRPEERPHRRVSRRKHVLEDGESRALD